MSSKSEQSSAGVHQSLSPAMALIIKVTAILICSVFAGSASLKFYEMMTPISSNWDFVSFYFQSATIAVLLVASISSLFFSVDRYWIIIAAAILSLFSLINARSIWLGETKCNCFGQFHTSPEIALTIDLFLLSLVALIALALRVNSHGVTLSRFTNTFTTSCGFVLIVFLGTAPFATMLLRLGDNDSLESPDLLAGKFSLDKRLEILSQIRCDKNLSSGRWVLLMHRENCPVCVVRVRQLEQFATESMKDKSISFAAVSVVDSAEKADRVHAEDDRRLTDPLVRGVIIDNDSRLPSPVIFTLVNGVVYAVSRG